MNKICVIIPVFNNEKTIKDVVLQSKKHISQVIVMNDGSTDKTAEIVNSIDGIFVENFAKNCGKGIALQKGFEIARNLGFSHAITIDADGQHFPEWINKAIDECEKNPDAILIGARTGDTCGENAPKKNLRARKFGNMWIKIYTGFKLSDTQSGFRVYPVEKMKDIQFKTARFEFEQEVLVKSAWAGINLGEFEIPQFYQPAEERVSHYRVFHDSIRISWFFTKTAFMKINDIFISELKSNITPKKAAFSFSMGVFFGIFPIYGFQGPMAVLIASFTKLNRPLALLGTMISAPPLLPFIIFAALAVGSAIFPNEAVTFSSDLFSQNLLKIGKIFIVGSIILAFLAGISAFLISYPICKVIKNKRTN